ncbi:MAG: TlpA family protein disulfide reductase [Actinobacteria bacterium]|nr:TlpA family protein disulfide reductase [Actinomycetota bacterium]
MIDPTPSEVRRSRRLLHLIALLIVIAPLVWWLIASEASTDTAERLAAEPGGPAPDFTLTLFDGTNFSLSRHLAGDGRPVVMNFWASWCVPCREEMPTFDRVSQRRPDVLVLGVAVRDTEDEARAFAAEVGVGYPLGIDADGDILNLYPILGLPTTWFITADGRIASIRAGLLDQEELERLIDQHLTGSVAILS